MFLLTKSQLKDHKGCHNEPHGETSPATTAVLNSSSSRMTTSSSRMTTTTLNLEHAHEVVDLLGVKGSISKKFPEFRGVLKGVDKHVDVRLVFEVFGELGDCLAGDVQPFQYVGKVEVVACDPIRDRTKIKILARILGVKKMSLCCCRHTKTPTYPRHHQLILINLPPV